MSPLPQTSPRRLRVLSLSTVFPSAERPTHGLFVEERLAWCGARAEVTVLAPVPWQHSLGVARGPEQRRGLAVHRPRFWYLPRFWKGLDGAALWRSISGLARRLHAERPFDLLDAHFAWPEGAAGLALARELGIPMTVTLRGTLEWLAEDPARGPRMAEVVREADRVIAVSHDLAARARALGASPQRVSVVPNGVDLQRFQPGDRRQARRELGLDPAGPLLVSVGHLSPRKGFQDLISTLPSLRATHAGAELALVGGPGAEGDNRARLEELARASGVAGAVHFLGARDPAGVAQALQACDLFAFASRYEGCPNVVLEALACGRPVVSSAVG
ncbi:MAG: glycosyltransferase, partial [Planctomycetota bacterium]|nr:glycosyltransferase [Planctomycetota bacterium]